MRIYCIYIIVYLTKMKLGVKIKETGLLRSARNDGNGRHCEEGHSPDEAIEILKFHS